MRWKKVVWKIDDRVGRDEGGNIDKEPLGLGSNKCMRLTLGQLHHIYKR